MTTAALQLENVHKSYGATQALAGLTLSVPQGALCGLIGPNGAGKTTTFGIVGGAIQCDSGRVDILGHGAFDARVHAGRLSLLPQDCELNTHTSIEELLGYYAELQGMTAGAARREAARVLDAVRLGDRKRAKIKQLSHGMRRRVAIAQALLGSPELILLDEPTSGLDPELVVQIKDVLRSCRGTSTLVISSHVLADLEALCDYVVFLEAGRCRRQGSLSDVTGQAARVRVQLRGAPHWGRLRDLLGEVAFEAKDQELTFAAPSGWDLPQLNAKVLPALLEAGAEILEVRRGESLESAYLADLARSSKTETRAG